VTLIEVRRPVPAQTIPRLAAASQPVGGPVTDSGHGDATRRWRRWLPLTVVVLSAVLMTLPLVWAGVRLGQDSATQFYPWYHNLGERLRAGGVPEWNPHQFSGAPLAADPQSGWTYLPAMLAFTLLPFGAAVVAQIFGHLLLANLGMWLLARRLGLGQVAALVAGLSFAGSGVLYGRIPSGPASYEVCAWLPWVLLGAELALRTRSWPVRVAAWGLTGLAVSQALAAWVGQVSYYALLLLAAWIAYRVLWGGTADDGGHPHAGRWAAILAPVGSLADKRPHPPTPSHAQGAPRLIPLVLTGRRGGVVVATLGRLLIHGGAMLLIGLGLSAAGLLPRLEFNAVSNAAGGEYATASGGVIGGSSSGSVLDRLFQPTIYYPGAAVLALAVVGILLGRGRFALPFWLLTALGAIVLTIPVVTPLHWLLYLLPRFRQLHEHWPERVILVAFPGLALMAGAGVQVLVDGARSAGNAVLRGAAVVLPGLILAAFAVRGGGVSGIAIAGVIAVALVSLIVLFGDRRAEANGGSPGAQPRAWLPVRWLPAGLVLVVAADLLLTNQALAGQGPFGGFHRRHLDAYYAPSGAAAFLRDRYEQDGPFRFAGYDPAINVTENGQTVLYRYQFADPITRELAVNNRATLLGLEDVQGYNPIQVAAYVDLVTSMNGARQEYHGADLLPVGLDSPLLDLLGVRYLIVPSAGTDGATTIPPWPIVYDDGSTRVVENPEALPRLWAVDGTMTVAAGGALPLLASGQVNPRTTAVFEEGTGPALPSPPVPPGAGPAAAPILTLASSDDPDTVRFTSSAAADTVVVLSEVAYPAWTARVDGQPVELLTADHALHAVVVPAGDHEVVLRYDSPATRTGLVVTLATLLVVVMGWLVAVWRTGRHRRGRVAAGQ